MKTGITYLAVFALVPSLGLAEPPSQELHERHRVKVAQMKQIMAGPDADDTKFQRLAEAIRRESDADYRRDLLALAAAHPGVAQESFLIDVLRSDSDWTVRSEAAKLLGRFGSEAAVAPLAKAAAKDRVTEGIRGCIGGKGTARRDAIFALAELGRRLPAAANRITEEVRKLPDANPSADGLRQDHLGDARRQALFQLTQDRALLKPIFEQLASEDAKSRVGGVVAFRFLNLSSAPAELITLARDPSAEVRSAVAFVLGEIGDAKTIPLLIEIAEDARLDRGTRCNAIASLGRMRAADARPLIESLLSDENLKVNAAIALSQITGKRHPLVPDGYGGPDWPRNSGL
jgi:HEAT repeat protein